jgi:phage minor structural protein
MIPILYDSITVGTVPTNYGRGALSDCLGYEVTEKKNGSYELVLTYPATGIHAEDLKVGAIIKAKANYTDDPQLFFIYRVGKTINGSFTCNARHISYYLSGKVITSGTAANVAAACALLQSQATGWTISTNKSTAAAFKITEPSSVRSWFGGKAGSLIDVYGGEWHFDNFTCRLLATRGADRGVTIRYGKNLTELSQSINMENLATSVQGYYKDTQTGAVTLGTKMPTGLQLSYPRDVVVDFSGEIDTQSSTPIATQINALTTKYISGHVLDRAINSITLNIVQEGTGADRVELGDTVKIYFEALGITATTRCVAVTWDGLRDRYKSATFGDVRADITDTIVSTQKEAAQAVTTDAMVNAVNRATSLITGNSGGYVVLHDSDNDGEPDEILIMNTPDIATATKVWRWNKSGLGYSSTGYAGVYGLAMTADGEIVADFITTGVLNADLIKAGTISDTGGKSTINMTTGVATLYNLNAKNMLSLIDAANTVRAFLDYTDAGGTALTLKSKNGNTTAIVQARATDGGGIWLYNNNGTNTASLSSTTDGGYLYLNNPSGSNRARMHVNPSGAGGFIIFNASGTSVIDGDGNNGRLTCVSLVQTSSRKVKENIKPIEDSAKILELDAVSFDYKDKAQGTDKRGFIAEDVAKVLPNLVTPETEDTPATLDYIGMIPYMQDVIKAQAAKIAELEERLTKLEG